MTLAAVHLHDGTILPEVRITVAVTLGQADTQQQVSEQFATRVLRYVQLRVE